MRFNYDQLTKGCQVYVQKEQRDDVYRMSRQQIEHNWGAPNKIAGAISDLLWIWHLKFYRFGPFSLSALQNCIIHQLSVIQGLRLINIRDIKIDGTFVPGIKDLFEDFLNALARRNSRSTSRSPVAVAKALNLLAPALFPLWDEKISLEYDCWWVYADFGANDYVRFMEQMQSCCWDLVNEYMLKNNMRDPDLAEKQLIQVCLCASKANYDKSLLKLIDEYNYAKFTTQWI